MYGPVTTTVEALGVRGLMEGAVSKGVCSVQVQDLQGLGSTGVWGFGFTGAYC